MIKYRGYVLNEELVVNQLYSFYYHEQTKRFRSIAEKHDFWELVYVDKGEVVVITDSGEFHLKQGELVFFTPNELHQGWAVNNTAPHLMNISFDCKSPCMHQLANQVFRLDEHARLFLSTILEEARSTFQFINTLQLMRSNDVPFASEQLIKINLEALLIWLKRKEEINQQRIYADGEQLQLSTRKNANHEIVQQITEYLQQEIHVQQLDTEQLCKMVGLSRTHLNHVFRSVKGISVLEYYNQLKINRAKTLIREESYNFTQIAEQLGFASLAYFSRYFKQKTSMSPTEYARTLRAQVPHYSKEK